MKKLLILISMLVMALLVTACGGSGKNVVTDKGELTKVMEELQNKEQFKGKDIYVFQDVNVGYNKDIGGSYVYIEVLQPGTENVDHYDYRNGSWSGPTPVKITGSGNMADNVILLKDLHFEKLPDIYKALEEKVKDKKDVKVDQNLIYRFWKGEWSIMMKAESDREEYNATFNLDGSLKEFKKR